MSMSMTLFPAEDIVLNTGLAPTLQRFESAWSAKAQTNSNWALNATKVVWSRN